MWRPPFNVPPLRPEAAPQHGEVWRSLAYLGVVASGEPRGTEGAMAVELHHYREAVVRVTLDMNAYFLAAFDVVKMEMMRPMFYQPPEGRLPR